MTTYFRRIRRLLIVGGLLTASPLGAANILFIGEPETPTMGDPFVLDHLEELGHNVTFEFGLETMGDDVAGYDLLIMSSTNLTSNIRENGFESIPQPILTWESSMVRTVEGEFWMSEDQQSGDNGSFITVTDASHPVMAGLNVTDGEELEIFTEDQNLFGLTGEIAPGATVIAVGAEPCCDEDRTMIVDLPAGAQTLPGSGFQNDASPGHRLFLMISDTSFEFLNEAGLQIFDNALNYILGVSANEPGDFNGDGILDATDIDLLSAAVRSQSNDPTFDLTGEGVVDNQDRIVWVNDLKGTYFGDANLDGEFNSADFVVVFQATQYEDAEVGNSTWATGDWNGDAEFNSTDFVTAFQANGYEKGPRGAASAVPEPATGGLMIVALVGMMLVRPRTAMR